MLLGLVGRAGGDGEGSKERRTQGGCKWDAANAHSAHKTRSTLLHASDPPCATHQVEERPRPRLNRRRAAVGRRRRDVLDRHHALPHDQERLGRRARALQQRPGLRSPDAHEARELHDLGLVEGREGRVGDEPLEDAGGVQDLHLREIDRRERRRGGRCGCGCG